MFAAISRGMFVQPVSLCMHDVSCRFSLDCSDLCWMFFILGKVNGKS